MCFLCSHHGQNTSRTTTGLRLEETLVGKADRITPDCPISRINCLPHHAPVLAGPRGAVLRSKRNGDRLCGASRHRRKKPTEDADVHRDQCDFALPFAHRWTRPLWRPIRCTRTDADSSCAKRATSAQSTMGDAGDGWRTVMPTSQAGIDRLTRAQLDVHEKAILHEWEASRGSWSGV